MKDDNNLLYYKHFPHGVSDGSFNVCEFPTTQPSKEIHVVADEKVEFNINTLPPQVPPPEENINFASHVTFIIDDTEVELEVIHDLITSVEIQEKKSNSHSILPICGRKMKKCHLKISDKDRELIYNRFWGQEKHDRKTWIQSHVHFIEPTRLLRKKKKL